MKRLLSIEFNKYSGYRPVWILLILYFVSMAIVTGSGMEFLRWLKNQGVEMDDFDPTMIPFYQFPDVWHNITYLATLFKFIPAFVVIIGITNEFSFKTLRQNIIDGLDRSDFLKSKLYFIFLLSLAATIVMFLVGVVTGFAYTPTEDYRLFARYLEFIPAFFLETFSFLTFSLFVGIAIKRTGFAIGLLVIYSLILENIVVFNLPEWAEGLQPFFPIKATNNLIRPPFQRYILMEIQDHVKLLSVLVLVGYTTLFIWLSHLLLKKRDIM